MMRLSALERWAAGGTSWLHRSSASAKWLLVFSVILLAMSARSPAPLVAAYLLLALAAATCGLPLRPLLLMSLMPAPMIGLFALSQWDGAAATPVVIVGKGVVTAFAGLLLAATTPYPDLLAPVTRILPRVVADSLVLTYRAVFILWGRVEMLRLAIRARGGFFSRPVSTGGAAFGPSDPSGLPSRSHLVSSSSLPWPAMGTTWRRRFDVTATGAALAVLRGADLSTRLYDVMRLRGYQGKLATSQSLSFRPADWRPALLALALVAIGVFARRAGV